MSSKEQAIAAKNRGNSAFQSGDFEKAVEEFSAAISLDPSDHIFFSNRSGAYASLKQYDLALNDAEQCIKLKPDFAKGFGRLGTALYGLNKFDDAKKAYSDGLKVDSNNAQLKEGLEEASRAAYERRNAANNQPNPFGKMFGPEMWTRLALDPTTKPLLDDPAFVQKLKMLQANPQNISTMLNDPQISQCLGVILGIGNNFGASAGGAAGKPGSVHEEDDMPMDEEEIHVGNKDSSSSHSHKESKAETKSETKTPEAAAPLSDEEKTKLAQKKEAEAEKNKGNEAYKAKKFDEAISYYTKAAELDPANMVYQNNLAAVYFELKNYEKCIELAKNAINIGQEHQASFKDKARAWERIGNANMALKQLDEAIDAYGRSLIEEGSDKVRKAQKQAEELKKKLAEEAYLDKDKSEEHKQLGNNLYNEGKYGDAIKEYTEALRRDPTNYKVYSNRAACYSKMMEWGRALEDCDKALAIDPKFVKALVRKGKIHKFLKQFHKALDVLNHALELDPTNGEALDAKREVIMSINTSAADPERAKRAMEDPEIQAILRDPTMNKVLSDMQSAPETAQAAMRDKDIRSKIEKLIAAGVLQVK